MIFTRASTGRDHTTRREVIVAQREAVSREQRLAAQVDLQACSERATQAVADYAYGPWVSCRHKCSNFYFGRVFVVQKSLSFFFFLSNQCCLLFFFLLLYFLFGCVGQGVMLEGTNSASCVDTVASGIIQGLIQLLFYCIGLLCYCCMHFKGSLTEGNSGDTISLFLIQEAINKERINLDSESIQSSSVTSFCFVYIH